MIVQECDQNNGSEMSQAVLDVLYATEVQLGKYSGDGLLR